jgi:hypothetical protein
MVLKGARVQVQTLLYAIVVYTGIGHYETVDRAAYEIVQNLVPFHVLTECHVPNNREKYLNQCGRSSQSVESYPGHFAALAFSSGLHFLCCVQWASHSSASGFSRKALPHWRQMKY